MAIFSHFPKREVRVEMKGDFIMFDELVELLYTKWSDSENYKKHNCMENGAYHRSIEHIENATGRKLYLDIEEYIISIVVESEYMGFEAGPRYGMRIMQEGGAV